MAIQKVIFPGDEVSVVSLVTLPIDVLLAFQKDDHTFILVSCPNGKYRWSRGTKLIAYLSLSLF